jgi:hypothetical protein
MVGRRRAFDDLQPIRESLMRRLVITAIVAAAMSTAGSLGAPDAALADRCQPEEFVLGQGNSPIGHDENDPRCPLMDVLFYDQVDCDSSKFMTCVNTLSATGTVARQRDCDRVSFTLKPACASVNEVVPAIP